ncbi:MAG TPA: S8 family serine peptidase [Planctomycetota bacterium]|jgi:subtilisin family serine protease|nr:S8 family serine peptidase [Planctomycetota bacterium]
MKPTPLVPLAAGLALALGALAVPATAQEYVAVRGAREFTGELIARPRQAKELRRAGYTEAQTDRQLQLAHDRLATFAIRRRVAQTDEVVIRVPAGRTENDVSRELMATGLYQYVEPNWKVYPIGFVVAPPANCTNDPSLSSQWHHDDDRMDSCDAWTITTGDPSISVGICDTGVLTTHEDLQLHRLEGYNAVDQLWESQGGSISPVHPHGTMTTGCAAANGNNGIGVSGVGWDLSHRMLRVSNDSSGSASLDVLQHAARTAVENGDRVASVSYSGVDDASNLTTATYIKSIGGLLVWAAGNDGRNLTFGNRDADDIIVAGATDSGDNLASFSAFGQFVDVVAPGVSVFTTDASANNAYTSVSGTSFATPLTAGLCALIWSADPTLSPDDVEQVLKNGCQDLGAAGVDDTFGYGRIDSFGAMQALPKIQFNFPNGLPEVVDPKNGTPIRVEVLSRTANPIAGSGRLHYFDGASDVAVTMNVVSPNVYDAVIPAVPGLACGGTVSFYFSSDADDGHTYTNPSNAPSASYSTLEATTISPVASFDFETQAGWTVNNIALTDGAWEAGVPAGDGSRGDPTADFDGSGKCYLTANRSGNSDVDGGPTQLISPTFDLTGLHNVHVSYARWFSNDDNDIDRLLVEVSSNNGSTWTTLESVGGTTGWVVADFALDGVVTLNNQFKIRFSATDNPNDSVTEAALDRFQIVAYDCPLLFDVSPDDATLNAPVKITTWKGVVSAPAALFVVDLNGTPLFLNIALGTFNASGDWVLNATVPNNPAYQGLDIGMLAIGFPQDGGKVQITNVDTLSIH